MQHQQLIRDLFEINVVKIGNFTLKSGKQSPIYIDLRQIISYPSILRAVAQTMWQQIENANTDLICGVPYTALPIATCISLEKNIPMLLKRKETKDYGTKQKIEGAFKHGQECIVFEDVITTGSSVLETAHDLQQQGLVVKNIVVLVDREQGGRESINKAGFNVHSAFTLSELIHSLSKQITLNQSELSAIEEYIT